MKIKVQMSSGHEYSAIALEPFQYYRVPHDIEIKYGTASVDSDRTYRGDGNVDYDVVRDDVGDSGHALPEVYRFLPDQTTSLSCGWIKLWKDLNPLLSVPVFATLLDNNLAWTNSTGWPGRYNCLTGSNADKQNPAFHAPIINGGAILKGTEVGGTLQIEGLLTTNTIPTAQWVLERPWLWFYGTQVAHSGKVTYIARKGMDGLLKPVRVPILTKIPISIPLAYLDKLPVNFIPPTSMWLPSKN